MIEATEVRITDAGAQNAPQQGADDRAGAFAAVLDARVAGRGARLGGSAGGAGGAGGAIPDVLAPPPTATDLAVGELLTQGRMKATVQAAQRRQASGAGPGVGKPEGGAIADAGGGTEPGAGTGAGSDPGPEQALSLEPMVPSRPPTRDDQPRPANGERAAERAPERPLDGPPPRPEAERAPEPAEIRPAAPRVTGSPAPQAAATGSQPTAGPSAPQAASANSAAQDSRGGPTIGSVRGVGPSTPPKADQAAAQGAAPARDPEAARVAAQIGRGLAAALRQNGGVVTLRLKPETLGELRVRVQVQAGRVEARFEAATARAAALIDRTLGTLRTALEDRGLTVDRLTIHTAPAPGSDRAGGQAGADHDPRGPAFANGHHHAGGEAGGHGGRSAGGADHGDAGDPAEVAGAELNEDESPAQARSGRGGPGGAPDMRSGLDTLA
ncbi:MAG: flagellar hook-length control protein FliK [Phycisphaerales bacterium]